MIPALDYEEVKDYFFTKLEKDRHGKGRMESALYHTAQFIFERGCFGRDKLLSRIAELEHSGWKEEREILLDRISRLQEKLEARHVNQYVYEA